MPIILHLFTATKGKQCFANPSQHRGFDGKENIYDMDKIILYNATI